MKLQTGLMFTEHMILQRGKEIPVWGTSIKNDTVTVSLNNQTLTAVTERGKWKVVFPAMDACLQTSLKIESALTGEKIEFNDVAIGEVWLAGGQSNMEFLMRWDVRCEEMKKTPVDNYLRCFTVPQTPFSGFELKEPLDDCGFWRRWNSDDERINFSAVGAYMGMILREKLNVPVGIISCNWGGTPAAAWTAMEDLVANPALKPILDWHEEAVKNTRWESYIRTSEMPNPIPTPEMEQFNIDFMMGKDMSEFFKAGPPPMNPDIYTPFIPGPRACIRPSGLYENMLKKVAPYGIKGAIWYQGEDDDARGWQQFYDESMKTLITSWRKLWGFEMPFLQVELAPFRGIGVTGAKQYALLRHKQFEATSSLENAYDICILDSGWEFNIHPRVKTKVGRRLAHVALKHVYGDNSLVADMPKAVSVEVEKGQLTVSFENVAEGLEARGDLRKYLQVCVNDEAVPYEYRLEKDQLVILTEIRENMCVKYCEDNYVEAVLFNSEDNPVYGFTFEV